MITDSAALVLFAIRSAIRLGEQTRQAYIESTQRRALVLPLPHYFAEPDASRARNFFEDPAQADFRQVTTALSRLRQAQQQGELDESGRLRLIDLERLEPCLVRAGELLDRWVAGLKNTEKQELIERWWDVREVLRLRRLGSAEGGATTAVEVGECLGPDAFVALLSVRQWSRGEGPPTVLHRMAGTFIEIGADYLRSVPGALDPASRHGRIIGAFLGAMEKVDITTLSSRQLPARLFIATLETIGERPEILVADERGQALVRSAATGLMANVNERLARLRAAGGSLVEEDRHLAWGELVFRSLLGSAGRLVIEQPGRFLGIEDGASSDLIQGLGNAFLDALADAPDGSFQAVLSRSTLDRMLDAALGVLAEHPELLARGEGKPIHGLIVALAKELSGLERLTSGDALPVIFGLILERTSDHLELLWPEFASKPGQHLLLTAAGTTLRLLAREPGDGQWKVRFTRADALALVESVLDEVVANPAWLADGLKKLDKPLAAALEACLDVLRQRGDARLSAGTARHLLQAAIHAVSLRQEFLVRLPASAAVGGGRPVIAGVLEVLMTVIYDPQLSRAAAWQLVRETAQHSLAEVSMRILARTELTVGSLMALAKILRELADDLSEGASFDLADFTADLTKELGLT
jgi:hypothetical protein